MNLIPFKHRSQPLHHLAYSPVSVFNEVCDAIAAECMATGETNIEKLAASAQAAFRLRIAEINALVKSRATELADAQKTIELADITERARRKLFGGGHDPS